MNSYWQEFSSVTKFSVVAFFISGFLGFFSMGALGMLLHYPISFITKPFFGTMNTWSGDWLWHSAVWVGILWSFGFMLAALVFHYLSRYNLNFLIVCLLYLTILWLWALSLWLLFLSLKK
ncbi:MAG: hypothetical protein O9340_00490 [Cyclobacteriaceae bacterium]|jgi:hypothetical protein|nr:hypothetical protein [Cyclobacteriaceae bacterium]